VRCAVSNNSYILLILGIIFVLVGIWMWKKDREQFEALENRLAQKERSIYELYESLEELLEEADGLYRQLLTSGTVREGFQNQMELEYGKAADEEGYNNENNENDNNDNNSDNLDIKIKENDIENIIFELKKEGVSEEDIAKQLEIGKGEVKLILELKKDRSRDI